MRGRVVIVLMIMFFMALTAGCLCFGPDDGSPSDKSIMTGPDMNVPDVPPIAGDHQAPEPSYTIKNTSMTNYRKTDDGYYFSWSKTYESNDPADLERIRAMARMPVPTPEKISVRIFNATYVSFGRK